MRFLSLLLLLLVAACGYHAPGNEDSWVGGDERVVYVKLFENKSAEPYLDNYMTEAMIKELARSRLVVLTENREKADLYLEGSVDAFEAKASAYSAEDKITDYRAFMKVSVSLLDKDASQVIWAEKFRGAEDYLGADDKNLQLSGQRLAAKLTAQRIAEDIHSHLLNTF